MKRENGEQNRNKDNFQNDGTKIEKSKVETFVESVLEIRDPVGV